jgi:PadR family transcriptional regulator PadR
MTAESGLQRELRRATLELALLHLLVEGDRYGYELVADLASRTGGMLAVKEGTLYPILYRLEENGLVEVYWQTLARGNPRKYYRLTTAGREAYQQRRVEWHQYVSNFRAFLEGESR